MKARVTVVFRLIVQTVEKTWGSVGGDSAISDLQGSAEPIVNLSTCSG
jgi:hypothetical protein